MQIARCVSAALRLGGRKAIVCDLDNTLWEAWLVGCQLPFATYLDIPALDLFTGQRYIGLE